jgi:hypothetical protein
MLRVYVKINSGSNFLRALPSVENVDFHAVGMIFGILSILGLVILRLPDIK